MPIPRTEIIETLDALAGPLGPQTSLDGRLERQDRWVDEGGVDLLESLLAVVASPPSEEQLRYASLDNWNTLLVEVAGALGKRYPEAALQHLLPLLDDEEPRALGHRRAVTSPDECIVGADNDGVASSTNSKPGSLQ